MTNRHSNTGNQFEFQIASDFWQGGANSYIRTIEDGSAKAWRKLVTENASGNVSIGGSINTSGSITSAGPISVNTETWGLLLRDAA
jgi:hypothetical protein